MSQVKREVNPSPEARDAIYNAIEKAYKQTGVKPKYSDVQAIYKTSNSYIKLVMEQWLDDRSEDLKAAENVETPKAIDIDPSSIEAIKSVLVQEAVKIQEREQSKYDVAYKKIHEIKDEAEQELAKQMELYDGLYAEGEDFKARIGDQDQKIEQLEANLSTEKLKHGDALAVIERNKDDISRLTTRNDALASDLNTAQQSLFSVTADLKAKDMQLDEFKAQADRLKAEIAAMTERTAKELDQKDAELRTKDQSIAKLEQRIEQLSIDSFTDKSRLATLEGNNNALNQQLQDTQARLAKADDKANTLNESLLQLKGELKAATDKVANLEKKEKTKQ